MPASPLHSGSSSSTTPPRSAAAITWSGAPRQPAVAIVAALPVFPRGRYTNPVAAVLVMAAVTTEALSVRGLHPCGLAAARQGTFALGALINA